MFFSGHIRIAFDAFSHSLILVGEVAGVVEDPGSERPRLAVHIPPHAPAPGQARLSISSMIWSGVIDESLDQLFSVSNKYTPWAS